MLAIISGCLVMLCMELSDEVVGLVAGEGVGVVGSRLFDTTLAQGIAAQAVARLYVWREQIEHLYELIRLKVKLKDALLRPSAEGRQDLAHPGSGAVFRGVVCHYVEHL